MGMSDQAAPCRILVVEDNRFLATMVSHMLATVGISVVGPFTTVPLALRAAEAEAFEAALLDLNLYGEKSYPVAEVLDRRGIPYIFATGSIDELANSAFADRPAISKPYTLEDLLSALALAGEASWREASLGCFGKTMR